MRYSIVAIAIVIMCSACVNDDPLPTRAPAPLAQSQQPDRYPECPKVNSLDVAAFKAVEPGGCVVLIPPAAPGPDLSIWCPVGAPLPPVGNKLNLIGETKALIRRVDGRFDVVKPGPNGTVTFTPLVAKGDVLTLNGEAELFRRRSDGQYECLVPTIVGQPE